MRTNVYLLFYLKKPKNYESGAMPIYLRFTINGKRSETATGIECDPRRWNAKAGRAAGTKEDARSLNSYLDSLQSKALEAHRLMSVHDELITADSLKSRFTGKSEKVRTLVTVFTDHNKKMESLLGQEFERSTLKRYETCLMHVQGFLKLQYGTSDWPVHKIDFIFLSDFEYYLRSIRKCGNNTSIKYLKNSGKIVRICLGNG